MWSPAHSTGGCAEHRDNSDQFGIMAFDGELVACAPRSVAELPSIHRGRKMPMDYSDMHVCVIPGGLSYFAAV